MSIEDVTPEEVEKYLKWAGIFSEVMGFLFYKCKIEGCKYEGGSIINSLEVEVSGREIYICKDGEVKEPHTWASVTPKIGKAEWKGRPFPKELEDLG
ncbi:MAG TPA: hypothetical protein ENI23_10095, partial [bacterium]|nr:hypothetical protein [bacterium]